MRIVTDTPLDDITQDKLGREPIVDLIVESINNLVLSNHQCMVYGIYGKWGEGKTSLMNFLKQRFLVQNLRDNISLVEFNPWLVNNDEALLREFFKAIMVYPDKDVREAFKKYGSLAIFASKTIVNAFAPGLGSALANGVELATKALDDSQDTLSELKRKASEAIEASNKHLIVMIDDVDRLDTEELHAVLRLIRQVADFPNCIYIVSMDVDMVAQSIGKYHGGGSSHEGRKFIDKIVQVPINLPQLLQEDIKRLLQTELSKNLHDYSEEEEINSIINSVSPFFSTCREVKRYCNQIAFVLPHLNNEVNIKDLCLLEAIKIVSAQSYYRIHEKRTYLMRQIDVFQYQIDKNKASVEIEKNYNKAKDYVLESLSGRAREIISVALDELFSERSYLFQENIDKKRIFIEEYFPKYFSQKVPSDIIPDRQIDMMRGSVEEGFVEEISSKINEWSNNYSASEVKRASLHLVQLFSTKEDRSKAASVIAKALSLCNLAKGLPYHIFVDPNSLASFVPMKLLSSYMFAQTVDFAGISVRDECLLDDTLEFIFTKAELNYCINLLCSSDNIFNNGNYTGNKVLPLLIKRFSSLEIGGHFKYSKFLLTTIYKYWRRVDIDSFKEYADQLFSDPSISYLKFMDKMIDGTDDDNNLALFVRLFSKQIPTICSRLQEESEATLKKHPSINTFLANYRKYPIID